MPYCPKCGKQIEPDEPHQCVRNGTGAGQPSRWTVIFPVLSLLLGLAGILTLFDDSPRDADTLTGCVILYALVPAALGIAGLMKRSVMRSMNYLGIVLAVIALAGIISSASGDDSGRSASPEMNRSKTAGCIENGFIGKLINGDDPWVSFVYDYMHDHWNFFKDQVTTCKMFENDRGLVYYVSTSASTYRDTPMHVLIVFIKDQNADEHFHYIITTETVSRTVKEPPSAKDLESIEKMCGLKD